MGYALLWLESLTAALLLIATVFAVSARWKSRWLSALLVVPAAMLVLLVGIAAVACSMYLRFKWQLQNDWMIYTVPWMIVLLAGLFVLRWRAGKITDGTRASVHWPRQRLALV